MIVEVPFVYAAHVVPPGKRNPREFQVIGRVPVRIPVAAPGELPVAFRFSPGRDVPWNLEGDDLRDFHDARAMEIRWDGKGLWAPDRRSTELDGEARRLSEAEATALVEDMNGSPFAGIQWGGLLDWQRRSVVREGALEGRVQQENRRERVADILAFARKVRFHDGRFWIQASEPCWIGDGDSFPTARAELASEFRLESPSRIWRADRLGHALADLDRSWGRADRTLKPVGYIEILIPEAVRLPVDEMQLVAAARATVDKLKDHLPKATVAYFSAFAELRDAARECPGDSVSERLAGAVAAMLAQRGPLLEDHDPDWRLNLLREANRRWRRSLEPEEPGHAPPADGARPRIAGR